MSDQLPFVIYRYPNDSELHGIYQEDATIHKAGNFKEPGFVLAPFATDSEQILVMGEYVREKMDHLQIEERDKTLKFSNDGKDFHLKLVGDAITEIKRGHLRKVVLSRVINTSTTRSPAQIFIALLAKYPSAFCYWWHHPKIGMWLGATPEQLLQFQNGEIFTTSLAGTLPVQGDKKPNWTPKEMEEQQMVTDYIAQSLEGRVTGLKISQPSNQKAGKLWHLKSTISGRLTSLDGLMETIKSIHPTPAVCGLPKMESLNYITRHENYHREYYTGFLGPINLDGKERINLFVNLRCLKFSSGKVRVFVGGGVTENSNPEREWEETQLKSGTILEVL